MPLQWLTNYWSHAGKFVLPYFSNRKIALEEKFNDQIIFRRHDQNKNWIYIRDQAKLDQYAHQHAFSFHPHQLSDDNIFWPMIDIDKRNDKLPFKYIIEVTKLMAHIFESNKQPFLLKYSGNRGFHIIWSMGKIKKSDLKDDKFIISVKQTIQSYADQLNQILSNSSLKKEMTRYFPTGHNLINTNYASADPKNSLSILIDKNIIRPNAVFRSPWSIHPVTNLVSAPLKVSELDNFNPQNYTVDKVLPQLRYIKIP